MNILNIPNSGFYAGVIAIWKVLIAKKTVSLNTLKAMISPQNVCGKDYFDNTLNVWNKLGLFVIDSNNNVSIAEKYTNSNKEFKNLLLDILVDKENNPNLLGKDSDEIADSFNRAMVFVFSQNTRTFYGSWKDCARDLHAKQFKGNEKDKPFDENDVLWNGFLSWASYFSLAKSIKDRVYFDFSPIIKCFFKDNHQKGDIVSIDSFLKNIADKYPFLQRGFYWDYVRSKMNPLYYYKDNELNSFFSMALYKLHCEDIILLDKKSDATATVFLLDGDNKPMIKNGKILEISHVEIK